MRFSSSLLLLVALAHTAVGKVGDPVAFCFEDRGSPPEPQHRLMADSSGLMLYEATHTPSVTELKAISQKHQHHPLTSAASDSMWSQSVFFLLVSWTKPFEALIRGIPSQSPPKHRNVEKTAGPSPFNLTFQKCAEVTGKNESQMVTVKLILSSMAVQSALNISQLTIRDNISGLSIRSNMGRQTEIGFQTYTKESLQAGEYYVISYTAVLNAGESQDWRIISLPAYLNFGNVSQDAPVRIAPLVADFVLAKEAVIRVSANHGIHFLGFIVAFVVSFALVCSVLIVVHVIRGRNLPLQQVERNQSSSSYVLIGDAAEQLKARLQLEDKAIDILVHEDLQTMTQAFNDLHMLNAIHTDTDLEHYRKRMNIDAAVLLLRNVKPDGFLSPLFEERLSSVVRGQFEEMENRLCVQHDGMLAALAAQSNQETREKMEDLYLRQRQEEAELCVQNMDEACREDLDQLHTLEQERLKYSLSVAHQEVLGNARRELVVRLRQAFRSIIFDQLAEVTRQEEFDATSASQLLHENWHFQFQLEKLMDQQLAFQRMILDKGLAHRKNLVNRIERGVKHRRNLLNTAALHIAGFANLVKNAGYLTDGSVESLLTMIQQEILAVKKKLQEDMDQEKKLIHCKLISERREHIVRKICEQEHHQKQLASLLHTSGERRYNYNKYLVNWHDLLNSQSAELGELVEKLDEEAVDQLETLHMQLTKNASLKIKKIRVEFVQELVRIGAPKDHLRQMAEDQDEEVNTQEKKQKDQEENNKRKANESLEKVREELSQRLQSEIEEQKFLRHWNQLVFQNILKNPLVLSNEEIQKMMWRYLDNFCQMDNSLALPKMCERSRTQSRLTEWGNTKLERLEKRWKKRDKLKTKELGHGDGINLIAQQERTRDKIKLYEEENKRAAEEMSVVCTELLHQRANQMKELEESLGACMASIQLCKAEKQVSALEIHIAILSLQTLLLEELSTAGSVAEAEVTQTVQAHIRELEHLGRLHSDTLHHELANQSERTEDDSWILTQSSHPNEDDAEQSSSQMFICLQQAMLKFKELMEAESKRLRNEDRCSQLLEDVKGQLLVKTMLSLQDEEMKLAAFLMQRLKVPMPVFQALLNLLLPNATEKELTLVVNGICPESFISSEINEDKVDEQGKRRLKKSKMSLDLKVRNKLIGEYLENIGTPFRKKRSILKRKRLQLMKQVSFSHSHCSLELPPAEADDHPESINEGLGQMLNMPDTGEKVFTFCIKEEIPCSSDLQPKKKKKRNFLNFKRSSVANMDGL
ncbi:limbin-like isoform X3 [Scyliorhinus canicula]|uniref:limbin-like isoform X3 n=1 Tax=Scyliorhinus canicula TaxID=7830 RepID=UPI0018F762DC|nr:limbin-like isoform X3 [Scyliorhinus canicula]